MLTMKVFVAHITIVAMLASHVLSLCAQGQLSKVDNSSLFGDAALDAAFQAAKDAGCTGSSSPDVIRINTSRLGDVVRVTGPDAIRAFELDPAFDRPAETGTPEWFAQDIRASRMFCGGDTWFSGFTSWFRADWNERTLFHIRSLHGQTHSDQEAEMAAAIMGMDPDKRPPVMIDFSVRLVARFFLPSVDIPSDVVTSAASTVLSIPAREEERIIGSRAQERVVEFVESQIGGDPKRVCDVSHNLGAALGLAGALARLSGGGGVLGALFARPVIPFTMRVVKTETTVGGLLNEPLEPGKTLVLLYIGEAAALTKDDNFLFGAGTERQCPFKGFYKRFAADVERRYVRLRSVGDMDEL